MPTMLTASPVSLEGKLKGLDPSAGAQQTLDIDNTINLETFDFNELYNVPPLPTRKTSETESTNPQTSPTDPIESPAITSIDPSENGSVLPDSFFMQEL